MKNRLDMLELRVRQAEDDERRASLALDLRQPTPQTPGTHPPGFSLVLRDHRERDAGEAEALARGPCSR